MQAISKQKPLPALMVKGPSVESKIKIDLCFDGFQERIKITRQGEYAPVSRVKEAINRGVDRFHREIRRESSYEDDIRQKV